jgi:hypothetical protein
MNDLNDQLRRLLASARQEHVADKVEIPFGLETRVMAEWRSLRVGSPSSPYATLYRQAILWSLGIACLAAISFIRDWTAINDMASWQNIEMRLANSAIQQHLP